MKRNLLLAAGMLLCACSGLAQNYQGFMDGATCTQVVGWAWQAPYQTTNVDIYDSSTMVLSGVPANVYRPDLQAAGFDNGDHGYSVAPPASLLDGNLHQIYVKFSGTQINLNDTPFSIQCTPASQGYTNYYQSTFGDPGNWTSNGAVSTANNLFSSPSEGSWISNVAVPDGTSNYQVTAVFALQTSAGSGGTYIEYLRATSNAISGQGTAIQVALSDPQFNGGGCTAALTVSDMVNGSSTQDGQWTVPCASGMQMSAVVTAPNGGVSQVGVILAGTEYWTQTSIVTPGQPGIGAIDTPFQNGVLNPNGVSLVAFGAFDDVPPGNVNPATVKTYLTPNEVDMSWAGVADNPSNGNGVGLMYYVVARDGSQIGVSYSADYTDSNVNPGETHTYQIYAEDWDGNMSSPASVFITVPPASSVDPLRVGVRPTGNYWGAMGEQIDTLSGNVNYSVALLKAMWRGGGSVPFGLSYNSQNWRQEGSTSWVMGEDVGYGFGWQLMAGSITPYWNGWALDHFIFTDATGAQYRLDQQNGSVWSSKQSIYVWYDYSTSLLHFKDGSSWYMGCTSSGEEPDAGAMYPTLMEDSNGNQITISYLPGAGAYGWNGTGANPPNTSARINEIQDTRSHPAAWTTMTAYYFTYDSSNHLASIMNTFITGENYSFTISNNQGLFSPFTNTAACGSTNSNCGYTAFLSSITQTGVNLTTSFSYDPNGYGDLTQVTLPYGGHIRWAYRDFTYMGNRTLQEVSARYLLKDVTASETTYAIARNDSLDASLPIHSAFTLIDPSGAPNNPGKVWSFNYNSSQPWMMGTAAQIESRNNYTAAGQHLAVMTWSQDARGNPYISQTDTYLDEGTANQQHSVATTTLDSDGYGNTISSQTYDYAANGGSPPLLRTNTTTYLNDTGGILGNGPAQYGAAYIRNRVVTQTVTPAGGSGITLASNIYDYYYSLAGDAPGLTQHDANIGAGYTLRGNLTEATTTTGTTSTNYDLEGNVIQTTDPLGSVTNVSVDYYGNVPQTATPNGNGNLSTAFSFSTSLAPTSVSQPSNGTSASLNYDQYGRVVDSVTPDGADTHYYYCPDTCNPSFGLPATRNGQNYSRIAVTNTRWSRDQYDGLGRVIRTDRGDTSGNVISNVDTNYDSCACSPTGKMVSKSQPYAPGASVYWTTYTYDGLGRTIQVTAADGASHTNYAYYGSTTVVTDPAGNWKAMTVDVDGNLKSVIEPDPAYNPSAPTSAQSINCTSTQAPSGMMGTCYAYDVFKNLTQVIMPRSNGTQTRTFTYQSGTNWLLSATNPENGTVSYTRDAMGNVTQRTDAKGQVTNYSYDSYHRLTQVTRAQSSWQAPDPCQTETYIYDQSIDPSFPSGASWGKLTAVLFGYGPGGNGTCPGGAPDSTTWGGITYEYQYSSAGRVTGKRMLVTRTPYYGGPQTVNLDAYWTYDNEGRELSVTYPVVYDPSSGNQTSTVYTYTYDTMGRPSTIPNTSYPNAPYVNGVTYNAADQLTAINYFGTGENREYNSMNQLTNLGSGAMGEQYIYPTGHNNGQISSVVEWIGETVTYQYDVLKRLIAVSSTLGWSQQYTYDGFGNMTYKSGNFSALADPATNHLLVSSYDANGNMYLGNWSYDVENRLASVDAAGGENYMYDPSNKRIYKQNNSSESNGGQETYYFYGADGKVLGQYTVDWSTGSLAMDLVTESAYFGGKKVLPSYGRDRLGSVRAAYSPANHPYGENYSVSGWLVTGADGFATYYQDASTGLNYADQRYYNATFGRFITPDPVPGRFPYAATSRRVSVSNPRVPLSWNRYTYVGGDPINNFDALGLEKADAGDGDAGSSLVCNGFDVPDPTWCGEPGPLVGTSSAYLQGYWEDQVLELEQAGVEIPTTTVPTSGGITIKVAGSWYQVIGGAVTRLAGLAAWVLVLAQPTGGWGDSFPTVAEVEEYCVPKGPPVVVPATRRGTRKGGTETQQEYICPDGQAWTVQTIRDKNGKIVHQHVRPGAPKVQQ